MVIQISNCSFVQIQELEKKIKEISILNWEREANEHFGGSNSGCMCFSFCSNYFYMKNIWYLGVLKKYTKNILYHCSNYGWRLCL